MKCTIMVETTPIVQVRWQWEHHRHILVGYAARSQSLTVGEVWEDDRWVAAFLGPGAPRWPGQCRTFQSQQEAKAWVLERPDAGHISPAIE
jgi:hypothetical protein